LVHVEDALVYAACCITVFVAMAVVDGVLENTRVPSVDEISVVPVTRGITMRVDKWLGAVHGVRPVEITGVPVKLHEDTGQSDREVGVCAAARIRAGGQE